MTVELILGDCLEVMRSMPDKSVDAVITDPPYNVGKDYGTYKDNLSPDDYKKWMGDIINESNRISKNGIAFYVGGKLTKLFFELIPEAHLTVVHKKAVGVMCGNYFMQYHCLFSTMKPQKKIKDLWDDIRLPGEGYYFRETRYNHPGLTSLLLTNRIVESFTKQEELVLDPFLGTGTTGTSCVQKCRNFIGIEIDPGYLKLAERRIKDAQQQMRLPL